MISISESVNDVSPDNAPTNDVNEICPEAPVLPQYKYDNIYDLANGNDQDRARYELFNKLLDQFTEKVDNRLDEMRGRYPNIYRSNCTKLYAFNLDFETLVNHNWVRMNFISLKKSFTTSNFSKTLRTKYLVTNVVRHVVRWLNDHYKFENPLVYQNVEMTWKRTDGTSKITNISFISF